MLTCPLKCGTCWHVPQHISHIHTYSIPKWTKFGWDVLWMWHCHVILCEIILTSSFKIFDTLILWGHYLSNLLNTNIVIVWWFITWCYDIFGSFHRPFHLFWWSMLPTKIGNPIGVIVFPTFDSELVSQRINNPYHPPLDDEMPCAFAICINNMLLTI